MAITRLFLVAGVLSAAGYVATDVLGTVITPGYSWRGQAVSELFAIGAPASGVVVPLFTLCSALLLAFAAGVWRAAGGRGLVRALALMFAGSAVVGLLIWNVFPMHMRGAERSFTDTMHLILAANPFVVLSLVLASVAFPGWLRAYTVVTAVVMVGFAVAAFSYTTAVDLNQPTPWLGATERAAQYIFELWQAILALALIREQRTQ